MPNDIRDSIDRALEPYNNIEQFSYNFNKELSQALNSDNLNRLNQEFGQNYTNYSFDDNGLLVEEDNAVTKFLKDKWNYIFGGNKYLSADIDYDGFKSKQTLDSGVFDGYSTEQLKDYLFNTPENPNAKQLVYIGRVFNGTYDDGSPKYSYKVGVAEDSVYDRYKNQLTNAQNMELLYTKRIAGAEQWENAFQKSTYLNALNPKFDFTNFGSGYTELRKNDILNLDDINQEKIYSNYKKDKTQSYLNDLYKQDYSSDSYLSSLLYGGVKLGADIGDVFTTVLSAGYLKDNLFDKLSDNAAKIVGYDKRAIERDIEEVYFNYENSNYWDMITGGVSPAVSTFLESLPEMLLYGLAPESAVLKASSISKNILALEKTALALKDATKTIDTVKELNIVNRKLNTLYKELKTLNVSKDVKALAEMSQLSKTMRLAANQYGFNAVVAKNTNEILEQRKANGDDITIKDILGVGFSQYLLTGLDKIAFEKIIFNKPLIQSFKETFALADPASKLQVLNKASSMLSGIAVGATVEAGQEYAQTWGEIIGSQVDTQKHNTLESVLSDVENQKQVIKATIMGGLSGGTIHSLSIGASNILKPKDETYNIEQPASHNYKYVNTDEDLQDNNIDLYSKLYAIKQAFSIENNHKFNDWIKDETVIDKVNRVIEGLQQDMPDVDTSMIKYQAYSAFVETFFRNIIKDPKNKDMYVSYINDIFKDKDIDSKSILQEQGVKSALKAFTQAQAIFDSTNTTNNVSSGSDTDINTQEINPLKGKLTQLITNLKYQQGIFTDFNLHILEIDKAIETLEKYNTADEYLYDSKNIDDVSSEISSIGLVTDKGLVLPSIRAYEIYMPRLFSSLHNDIQNSFINVYNFYKFIDSRYNKVDNYNHISQELATAIGTENIRLLNLLNKLTEQILVDTGLGKDKQEMLLKELEEKQNTLIGANVKLLQQTMKYETDNITNRREPTQQQVEDIYDIVETIDTPSQLYKYFHDIIKTVKLSDKDMEILFTTYLKQMNNLAFGKFKTDEMLKDRDKYSVVDSKLPKSKDVVIVGVTAEDNIKDVYYTNKVITNNAKRDIDTDENIFLLKIGETKTLLYDIDKLKQEINKLKEFAIDNKDKTIVVPNISRDIQNLSPQQVSLLFNDMPKNVLLSKKWKQYKNINDVDFITNITIDDFKKLEYGKLNSAQKKAYHIKQTYFSALEVARIKEQIKNAKNKKDLIKIFKDVAKNNILIVQHKREIQQLLSKKDTTKKIETTDENIKFDKINTIDNELDIYIDEIDKISEQNLQDKLYVLPNKTDKKNKDIKLDKVAYNITKQDLDKYLTVDNINFFSNLKYYHKQAIDAIREHNYSFFGNKIKAKKFLNKLNHIISKALNSQDNVKQQIFNILYEQADYIDVANIDKAKQEILNQVKYVDDIMFADIENSYLLNESVKDKSKQTQTVIKQTKKASQPKQGISIANKIVDWIFYDKNKQPINKITKSIVDKFDKQNVNSQEFTDTDTVFIGGSNIDVKNRLTAIKLNTTFKKHYLPIINKIIKAHAAIVIPYTHTNYITQKIIDYLTNQGYIFEKMPNNYIKFKFYTKIEDNIINISDIVTKTNSKSEYYISSISGNRATLINIKTGKKLLTAISLSSLTKIRNSISVQYKGITYNLDLLNNAIIENNDNIVLDTVLKQKIIDKLSQFTISIIDKPFEIKKRTVSSFVQNSEITDIIEQIPEDIDNVYSPINLPILGKLFSKQSNNLLYDILIKKINVLTNRKNYYNTAVIVNDVSYKDNRYGFLKNQKGKIDGKKIIIVNGNYSLNGKKIKTGIYELDADININLENRDNIKNRITILYHIPQSQIDNFNTIEHLNINYSKEALKYNGYNNLVDINKLYIFRDEDLSFTNKKILQKDTKVVNANLKDILPHKIITTYKIDLPLQLIKAGDKNIFVINNNYDDMHFINSDDFKTAINKYINDLIIQADTLFNSQDNKINYLQSMLTNKQLSIKNNTTMHIAELTAIQKIINTDIKDVTNRELTTLLNILNKQLRLSKEQLLDIEKEYSRKQAFVKKHNKNIITYFNKKIKKVIDKLIIYLKYLLPKLRKMQNKVKTIQNNIDAIKKYIEANKQLDKRNLPKISKIVSTAIKNEMSVIDIDKNKDNIANLLFDTQSDNLKSNIVKKIFDSILLKYRKNFKSIINEIKAIQKDIDTLKLLKQSEYKLANKMIYIKKLQEELLILKSKEIQYPFISAHKTKITNRDKIKFIQLNQKNLTAIKNKQKKIQNEQNEIDRLINKINLLKTYKSLKVNIEILTDYKKTIKDLYQDLTALQSYKKITMKDIDAINLIKDRYYKNLNLSLDDILQLYNVVNEEPSYTLDINNVTTNRDMQRYIRFRKKDSSSILASIPLLFTNLFTKGKFTQQVISKIKDKEEYLYNTKYFFDKINLSLHPIYTGKTNNGVTKIVNGMFVNETYPELIDAIQFFTLQDDILSRDNVKYVDYTPQMKEALKIGVLQAIADYSYMSELISFMNITDIMSEFGISEKDASILQQQALSGKIPIASIKPNLANLALDALGIEFIDIADYSMRDALKTSLTSTIIEQLYTLPFVETSDMYLSKKNYHMIFIDKQKFQEYFSNTISSFNKSFRHIQYLSDKNSRFEETTIPVKYAPKTILHSTVELSDSKKQLIIKNQSKPFIMSDDIAELIEAYKKSVNKSDVLGMFGYVDINDNMSIQDKLYAIAINSKVEREFNILIEKYKKFKNKNIYFRYADTKSGRNIIMNDLNYQESKLHREFVHSKEHFTVINRNDKKRHILNIDISKMSNSERFEIALSQAFDLDPDKGSKFKVFGEIRDIVNIYSKNITILDKNFKWLDNFIHNKNIDYKLLKSAYNIGGVHAVRASIELRKMYLNRNNNSFTTTLTYEADAITSGSVLLSLQAISDKMLTLLEKGGIFTKKSFKKWEIYTRTILAKKYNVLEKDIDFHIGSLIEAGQYHSEHKQDFPKFKEVFYDIYTTLGIKTLELQNQKSSDINVNLSNAIGTLTLKVLRSVVKSPTMVFNYGALLNSIMHKVTEEVGVKTFYQGLLSKKGSSSNKFVKDVLIETYLTILKTNADKTAFKQQPEELKTSIAFKYFFNNIANFQIIDSETLTGRTPKDSEFVNMSLDDRMKNFVIPPNIYDTIHNMTMNYIGRYIAKALQDIFYDITKFRDNMKRADVLISSSFNAIFQKHLNSIVKKKGKKTYQDVLDLLSELQDLGLSHTVDIGKEIQPLYKQEQNVTGAKRSYIKIVKGTSTDLETLKFIDNSSAAATITIHKIDGINMEDLLKKGDWTSIYDAIILGLSQKSIDVTNKSYQNSTINQSIKFDILQASIRKLNNILEHIEPQLLSNELSSKDNVIDIQAIQEDDNISTNILSRVTGDGKNNFTAILNKTNLRMKYLQYNQNYILQFIQNNQIVKQILLSYMNANSYSGIIYYASPNGKIPAHKFIINNITFKDIDDLLSKINDLEINNIDNIKATSYTEMQNNNKVMSLEDNIMKVIETNLSIKPSHFIKTLQFLKMNKYDLLSNINNYNMVNINNKQKYLKQGNLFYVNHMHILGYTPQEIKVENSNIYNVLSYNAIKKYNQVLEKIVDNDNTIIRTYIEKAMSLPITQIEKNIFSDLLNSTIEVSNGQNEAYVINNSLKSDIITYIHKADINKEHKNKIIKKMQELFNIYEDLGAVTDKNIDSKITNIINC